MADPHLVGWASADAMLEDFAEADWPWLPREEQKPPLSLAGYAVIYAVYEQDGYDGSAEVLLRHKATGDLYTVEADHCSCYGLEGQWELKRTHVDVLRARLATRRRRCSAAESLKALEAFLATEPPCIHVWDGVDEVTGGEHCTRCAAAR